MLDCKKLIEVAMPIKEISAECVRDKSIRHGHISTLHLWWARRPLPVCRAVVFASLVPDPLDENCPQAFKEAVGIILGKENNIGDPYKPYEDIPYTAALDKMEDNLRNRLLMFIGKFSERYILNEKQGRKTDLKDHLSNSSLITWGNRNNEEIINKARKLIWVAHNSPNGLDANSLLKQFDEYFKKIKRAEYELYNTINRHISCDDVIKKENKLQNAIQEFLNRMPKTFDPFAGGGAIPLEAARLGCRSYGNDLNPVAHVIQKASLEYPQKFGKPIIYSKQVFEKKYGKNALLEWCKNNGRHADSENLIVEIPNRLAFDVEFYAKKLLRETESEVGYVYPSDDKGNKPIVYYWVRHARCSNPSCKANIPLLKQFYLSQRRGTDSSQWVHFSPEINGTSIKLNIKKGKIEEEGYLQSRRLKCPCCGNITNLDEIKRQSCENQLEVKLCAVIEESKNGKVFRKPNSNEINVISDISIDDNINDEIVKGDSRSLWITLWGYNTYGELFSKRQLFVLNSLVRRIKSKSFISENTDYAISIMVYLNILVDRIAMRYTMFNTWHVQQDTVEKLYGRQTLPMVYDFPEMNPFSDYTSSGYNQLQQIIDYINEENFPFISHCDNAASGTKGQFSEKSLDAVITDPPYYDAIGYADLSDFFYVWMKRILIDFFPYNFATPMTPKTDECTALKHHHQNNLSRAKNHFEKVLLQIFDVIEQQTSGVISIMFAHQSTEAWTTLCNSILGARMNITGSWAIDTEATGGLKEGKAYLSSSVTVSCKPSQRIGIGDNKQVRKAIEKKVEREVKELYQLGLRGADLLTACFGQAVSVFGQYEKVEKADGSEVTVAELLEMAKESAFNALLKGFDGDDFTKFYIGWLQLFGFSESDFDDAAKFARVGLTIDVADLFAHNLFIKKGNKQELAGYKERIKLNHRIGEGSHSFKIDFVHKAMALYEGANRNALLAYIAKVAASHDDSFWRVITSLCEILPQGSDDYKQASGLLLNKDSLIRESKNIQQSTGEQGQLF